MFTGGFAYMYVSVPHIHLVLVVTNGWDHEGAGNQTQVLCNSNKCFPLSHLPRPYDLILMRKTSEKFQKGNIQQYP